MKSIKQLLTAFLDSIKDYEHEAGKRIYDDERESVEFVEIFMNDKGQEVINALNKPKCGGCKVKTKDRDMLMLIAFFKFFRDNGEANIGMTIEQFVDGFLNQNKP